MRSPSLAWRRVKATTLGAIFCVLRSWLLRSKTGRLLVKTDMGKLACVHPWATLGGIATAAVLLVANPVIFAIVALIGAGIFALTQGEYEAALGAFLMAIAVPIILLLIGAVSVLSFGMIPLVFYLWIRWWMTSPPYTVTVSEETRDKLKKLGRG